MLICQPNYSKLKLKLANSLKMAKTKIVIIGLGLLLTSCTSQRLAHVIKKEQGVYWGGVATFVAGCIIITSIKLKNNENDKASNY